MELPRWSGMSDGTVEINSWPSGFHSNFILIFAPLQRAARFHSHRWNLVSPSQKGREADGPPAATIEGQLHRNTLSGSSVALFQGHRHWAFSYPHLLGTGPQRESHLIPSTHASCLVFALHLASDRPQVSGVQSPAPILWVLSTIGD